ncbi:hypothetical protein B0H12DRAFT_1087855 [Mycena haematopus]|nr:hypothetical protein B0H12DRAFT_1087855 [Mycena haematopus]
MSAPTSQLPSFSLVIQHTQASNILVTMHWQPPTHTAPQPQTTNISSPAAATANTPTQSQPTNVPVTPSHARRVYSTIKRAFQTLGARLRARRDT